MGIFDFFKKKNNRQENVSAPVQQQEMPEERIVEQIVEEVAETIPETVLETPVQSQLVEEKKVNELYEKIKIYNDYIVYSIALQLRGDFAPISAFENENGEIEGFTYTITDPTYGLAPQVVLNNMKEKFENELEEGKIKSYAILYHSKFNDDGNHALAINPEDLKAITLAYHFNDSEEGNIALPYVFENENVTFKGFTEFSHEENNEIMGTQLVDGKDYFTYREEIKSPEIINEAGIKIKKSNVHSLANMWGGIFGFQNFQTQKKYSDYLVHTMAMAKVDTIPADEKAKHTEFADVKFKTIISDEFNTIYPEVKTNFSLDFETKEIREWENVNNNEAIVAGSARDTFGLWFFPTDYAENKNKYQTQNKINVNVSGIIFVLDLHESFDLPDGTKTDEEFTAYKPSEDLPDYGCIDFIGKVLDIKETEVLEDGSVKGFILKLRLITNSEMEDFFTIDAFVNNENIRFETLTVGMQVAGAMQLQGRIAE
ncbi:hypothetical protein QWZ06_03480 [Chryseobacterium tructae]|uniref:Uncharacterized protein n=1 Tax=Chryseobacterium tructae TaxID=1037380 RepID=A0ABV7XTM0_9FLAO|nr:hypothetical protein [Chryseobacterium tructae]MDN3691387.1 hypothetical protein [Chryseobacterium tructae]